MARRKSALGFIHFNPSSLYPHGDDSDDPSECRTSVSDQAFVDAVNKLASFRTAL